MRRRGGRDRIHYAGFFDPGFGYGLDGEVKGTPNILDHLPERQRPWVLAILKRAYQSEDVKTATRLLRHLARRLDQEHPCAAASVREGLEETVTVLTLGISPRLQRSLATTNAAESLISGASAINCCYPALISF